jgi:hypothetical protein
VKPPNTQIPFFILLLSALLLLPWNAQCRIAETLDKCKARYGNPVEAKKDAALFLKSGLYVSAHFADGKVDEISYYKKSPKDPKESVCPTDSEAEILLRANAQDAPGNSSLLTAATCCGEMRRRACLHSAPNERLP